MIWLKMSSTSALPLVLVKIEPNCASVLYTRKWWRSTTWTCETISWLKARNYARRSTSPPSSRTQASRSAAWLFSSKLCYSINFYKMQRKSSSSSRRKSEERGSFLPLNNPNQYQEERSWRRITMQQAVKRREGSRKERMNGQKEAVQ